MTPDAETDEAMAAGHQERLRDLGIDRNGNTDVAEGETVPTNGTEPGPEERLRDAATAVAASPAPEPSAPPTSTIGDATVDTTTTLSAVGLGSFGAVTSFKTALEKAEGVTAVRLSLGSGGEFMYTVTHRTDVDMVDVAAAAQPGASVSRNADGVVHLSAGKHR